MTVTKIDIFNWKSPYYGPLSNHYHYQITDNSENNSKHNNLRYKSVTNYIYGHMLDSKEHIIRLSNFPQPLGIKNLYDRLFEIEIKNVIKDAVQIGYEAKIKSFPELKKVLLQTGNAPIIYKSKNRILGTGVGTGQEGKNLIGTVLVQIRRGLLTEKRNQTRKEIKENKDRQIYTSYVVYLNLIQLIYEGDSLVKYIGKSPEEIIDMLGGDEVLSRAPNQKVILEDLHYKSRALPPEVYASIKNPNNIAWLIRSTRLEGIKIRINSKIKDVLMDTYLEWVYNMEYPDKMDKYKSVKNSQIYITEPYEIEKLRNNLYNLYMEGKFPTELAAALESKIEELLEQIPTMKEIEKSKMFASKFLTNVSKDIDNLESENILPTYVSQSGEPVIISAFPTQSAVDDYNFMELFAPVDITSIFEIENLYFPSVTHYIMYRLIFKITRNRKFSYEQIINETLDIPRIENFKNPDEIEVIYEKIKYNYRERIFPIKYLKEALDIKFSDRNIQNILLGTENLTIVWGDNKDPVLGIGSGKKPGENICGKLMMDIRNNIKESRQEEIFDEIITEENIERLLEYDPMLLKWFQRRVRDMSISLNIVDKHLKELEPKVARYTINDPEYTSHILDIIYQPCIPMFSMSDDIKIPAPISIESVIRKQFGSDNLSSEIVEIIWKRCAVLIYYLVIGMKQTGIKKIQNILYNIEKYIEKDMECYQIIPNDDRENCIANALIRLSERIFLFDTKYLDRKYMSSNDLVTATSIILQAYFPMKILTIGGQKKMEKIRRINIGKATASIIENTDKSISEETLSLLDKYVNVEESETQQTDEISRKYKRPIIRKQIVKEQIRDTISEDESVFSETEEKILEDDAFDMYSNVSSDQQVFVDENLSTQQKLSLQEDEGDGVEQIGGDTEDFLGLGDSPYESIKPIFKDYMLNNVTGITNTNVDELIETLVTLLEFVKNYKKIPAEIKHNRIMFFAKISI